jgi:nitrite reductase/ring-hydroxylating ferredoxin subunit
MAWTKVLAETALPVGKREVVKVGKRNILLVNDENQLYAVNSSCPHMKLPLKNGKVENGVIVCPLHRSAFDLRTGQVQDWCPWPPVVGKLLSAISPAQELPVFPLRVEDGNILVDLPEA